MVVDKEDVFIEYNLKKVGNLWFNKYPSLWFQL